MDPVKPVEICPHCGAPKGSAHAADCPYGQIEALQRQLDSAGKGAPVTPIRPPAEPLRGVPEAIGRQLRSEHGDKLRELTKNAYTVVVRKPRRMEWRAFMTANVDPTSRVTSLEQLLRDCAVWCSPAATADRREVGAALDAMLEDEPGLAETFGGEVADYAGLGKVESRKNV